MPQPDSTAPLNSTSAADRAAYPVAWLNNGSIGRQFWTDIVGYYGGVSHVGIYIGNGQIVHANKALDHVRFSTFSYGGSDVTADLAKITIGSKITLSGVTWTVQDIVVQPTYYDFTVSPAVQGVAGVNLVEFEVWELADPDYVSDPGYWAANPPPGGTVQGLYQVNGFGSPAVNDTAYGIDLAFQRILVSEDWDVLSPIAEGTSGPQGPKGDKGDQGQFYYGTGLPDPAGYPEGTLFIVHA